MVDAIQTPHTPPKIQTEPLAPVGSNSNDDARANARIGDESRDASDANFKEYLDKTSISTLEQAKKSTTFDTVEDIKSNSVYKEPSDSPLV